MLKHQGLWYVPSPDYEKVVVERDKLRAKLEAAQRAILDAWNMTAHRREGPWPGWYDRNAEAVEDAIAAAREAK